MLRKNSTNRRGRVIGSVLNATIWIFPLEKNVIAVNFKLVMKMMNKFGKFIITINNITNASISIHTKNHQLWTAASMRTKIMFQAVNVNHRTVLRRHTTTHYRTSSCRACLRSWRDTRSRKIPQKRKYHKGGVQTTKAAKEGSICSSIVGRTSWTTMTPKTKWRRDKVMIVGTWK